MTTNRFEVEDDPVFICGTNRSGTTLLMALLDGHPELVVDPEESHFFLKFVPQFYSDDPIKLGEQIMLRSWHSDNGYYRNFLSHVPIAEVRKRYLLHIQQSEQELRASTYLTAAVLAYGEASGQLTPQTRHWVEKTPHNEQYAKLIFQWWPNAKCIHMIRDPRDYWLTLTNRAYKRKRQPPKLDAVVFNWQQSANLIQQNRERYGANRYLMVRYEDLVNEPERKLDRVAAFLGISNHSILFKPTKGGGIVPWKGNAVSNTYNSISSARVGLWRTRLSEKEVCLLERLLEDQMINIGYKPATTPQIRTQMEAMPYKTLVKLRLVRSYLQQRKLFSRLEV